MAISTSSARAAAVVTALCVSGSMLFAQTVIKPPKNKYTPEQDVKLGLEGAAEVRQQYPVIKDEKITKYLSRLGDQLVAVAPAELKHPAYQYSFTPVNLKEINAFALPGGPMFVNRGMFEAAASEGEVVGVMAHELSHVLLRHGTANASKAQNPWLQLGQLAGQVGGAVLGGAVGSAVAQGSQFGLGTLLLRYGRDFEKQAEAARKKAEATRVQGTSPTLPLARYAGTYADPLHGEVVVTIEGARDAPCSAVKHPQCLLHRSRIRSQCAHFPASRKGRFAR